MAIQIETRYGRWAIAGDLGGWHTCRPLEAGEPLPTEETTFGYWWVCEAWGARPVYPDDGIVHPGDGWHVPTVDLMGDEQAARALAINATLVDDEA